MRREDIFSLLFYRSENRNRKQKAVNAPDLPHPIFL